MAVPPVMVNPELHRMVTTVPIMKDDIGVLSAFDTCPRFSQAKRDTGEMKITIFTIILDPYLLK